MLAFIIASLYGGSCSDHESVQILLWVSAHLNYTPALMTELNGQIKAGVLVTPCFACRSQNTEKRGEFTSIGHDLYE